MNRGDIYTVSGGGDYVGKPRPAVIIRTHGSDVDSSVTLCAFTTSIDPAGRFRPLVEPSGRNGLNTRSRIMVDKITTVRQSRIGERIGSLEDERVEDLDIALAVFLDLPI